MGDMFCVAGMGELCRDVKYDLSVRVAPDTILGIFLSNANYGGKDC